MTKVFLGGTCNGSRWRDGFKSLLEIDYFDPVVDDWNEEAYQQELHERAMADYVLYVFTPKMTGFYAIAEVTEDSIKQPGKTIFAYLVEDEGEKFSAAQIKSLEAVGKMVERNGGRAFDNLQSIAAYLNANSYN